MTLEESKPNGTKYVEDKNGIKFLVEEGLLEQFHGFTIDYKDGWFSRGFQVIPNFGGSTC